MGTVLVTGGSGFVGSFCILELLKAGHQVRTTVRSLKREDEVRALMSAEGMDAKDTLRFFEADLSEDKGWKQATTGCDYVLHVASPFPLGIPKDENELIIPAREGALRVLRASRDAKVKRVVMTSSFAAIGYGHPERAEAFDESSWTNVDAKGVPAYHKSKTLAERAAWDFMKREAEGLELSVVNPVGIFGPALGKNICTSIQIIKILMDGGMPACPRIYFGVVDVRDVVDLHLLAMTDPKAKGERFLAVSDEENSIFEIAKLLRQKMGSSAKRVPKHQMPDWLVRALAMVDPKARQIVPELGKKKKITNAKAKNVLGWKPRTSEEAIVATAESLVRLRLLKSAT